MAFSIPYSVVFCMGCMLFGLRCECYTARNVVHINMADLAAIPDCGVERLLHGCYLVMYYVFFLLLIHLLVIVAIN